MSVEMRPNGQNLQTGTGLPPPVGTNVPGGDKVADPQPKAPQGDGVDAPRPHADAEAAASPRKAASSRLGTLARRLIKGAAVLGMTAALVVGGMFMSGKISQHQAPSQPVQIQAPHEVKDPSLPGGQGPPAVELQTPAENGGAQETQGRGPTLPTAPNSGAVETEVETAPNGPQIQLDRDQVQPQQLPQTFSPFTIRLDSARGE